MKGSLMNATFTPDDRDGALLESCIGSAVALVNKTLERMAPAARQSLNSLIFSGATVGVELILTPNPRLTCRVQGGGDRITLFAIEFPTPAGKEARH
jgi:hypothetical protein